MLVCVKSNREGFCVLLNGVGYFLKFILTIAVRNAHVANDCGKV